MRYALFTNEAGGILDDSWSPTGRSLMLVVNAACKEQRGSPAGANLSRRRHRELSKRALLALQGPRRSTRWHACAGLPQAGIHDKRLLDRRRIALLRHPLGLYGEDGFEISVPNEAAEALARRLLAMPEVKPIGLGARDSLRLEAGLCLYGHDIDTATRPSKRGLPGASVRGGARRADSRRPRDPATTGRRTRARRVGILPDGRQPARDHAEIQDIGGKRLGEITSGGFGPSLGGPVAMGYVAASAAAIGTPLTLLVRGKPNRPRPQHSPSSNTITNARLERKSMSA